MCDTDLQCPQRWDREKGHATVGNCSSLKGAHRAKGGAAEGYVGSHFRFDGDDDAAGGPGTSISMAHRYARRACDDSATVPHSPWTAARRKTRLRTLRGVLNQLRRRVRNWLGEGRLGRLDTDSPLQFTPSSPGALDDAAAGWVSCITRRGYVSGNFRFPVQTSQFQVPPSFASYDFGLSHTGMLTQCFKSVPRWRCQLPNFSSPSGTASRVWNVPTRRCRHLRRTRDGAAGLVQRPADSSPLVGGEESGEGAPDGGGDTGGVDPGRPSTRAWMLTVPQSSP